VSYFRFVRHEDVARFEREGWAVVSTDLGPHRFYSVLMQWTGSGAPA
jgi:hypothetical protein